MPRVQVFVVIFSISLKAQAQGFLWAPLDEPLIITCDFCGYTFDNGDCHGGIDFRAQTPRTVQAAADGVVELVDNAYQNNVRIKKTYGNRVVLAHPNGYHTLYAHLTQNSMMVTVGAPVEAGQELALTDNSGDSIGPHLHFEVRNSQGQRVDPYGDPVDQYQCIPDQNIPHTCGPNALWVTCPPQPWNNSFADADSDGYTVAQGDCDDANPAINSDAQEWCDGVDNNCTDGVDENWQNIGAASLGNPCIVAVGTPCVNTGVMVCTADGQATVCNADPLWQNAVSEICDGVDNNCNGQLNEGELCTNPPNSVCVNNSTLRVYAESGVCSGTCNYAYTDSFCQYGCIDDACTTDPCIGVVCNTPPPSVCNGGVLIVYSAIGSCFEGSCVYSNINTACPAPANGFAVCDNEACSFNCLSGYVICADSCCLAPDSWHLMSMNNAPTARWGHTVVWTGNEMIIWGGEDDNGYLNSGGRYQPVNDTWLAISEINAPTPRSEHTAVWSGSEMIVWGGTDNDNDLGDGGRYNPTTDTWQPISFIDAPLPRWGHTVVWDGDTMLIWGGVGFALGGVTKEGFQYDPIDDMWSPFLTPTQPLERFGHTAIWADQADPYDAMIIWGGSNGWSDLASGGTYFVDLQDWNAFGGGNLEGRLYHTAVWTGVYMLIWGGWSNMYFNTGGKFVPTYNAWVDIPTVGSPSPRAGHTAIWTGEVMVIWGGQDTDEYFNDGRYYNPDPNVGVWMPISTVNSPQARAWHTALWTGNAMIIWGGRTANGATATGGQYVP